VPLLLFAGTLLLQSAWILALPPFRGTDEFDHAYRAAAVAGGQWRAPDAPAAHGRGHLVVVPAALVAAAHPVCASYAYTGPANCSPVAVLGHGRVEVASAAATYDPVFYAVIGTVAKPFRGAAGLYAMRIAAAVLCALFVALAGWATSLWARSPWPVAAVVVAATPVLVFSLSVAAPNGLEMSSALTVWAALLGLHSDRVRELHARPLLAAATAGAVVLTALRSIGPLWLALVVVTAVVLLGVGTVQAVVAGNRRWVIGCAAVVVTATAASVSWTLSAGTNSLEDSPTRVPDRLVGTLHQLPLWFLQGIAAFPRRSDPAPPLTYLLVTVVLAALLVAGFRAAHPRLRVTLLLTLAVTVAVPVALTIPTIRVSGPIWQGRYGLPYAVGLSLLAGLALDDVRRRDARATWALGTGWLALAAAQLLAVLHVLAKETRTSPLAGSPEWLRAPGWVPATLMVAGLAVWALAARQHAVGPESGPRSAGGSAPVR